VIQVTLSFPDQAALVNFFANSGGAVSAPEKTAVADIAAVKVASPKPPKAQTAAPVAPAPVAAPAPATVEPEAAPAPAAAPAAVDYPTLQKAVFALAGKSRESAGAVAASFGVKTFKELPEAKWGDALAAVNAALAA
jgi:hypothetical protein